MQNEPSKTAVRAWARLLKAQRLLLASAEHALKAADLPPLAWYDVLLELERAGRRGLRPFELQAQLLLAQYNLSRLLDRIEKAGYIERRPHAADGRGQVVVISGAGRTVRGRMWPVYAGAIGQGIGDCLTETQTARLDTLLGAMIEHQTSAVTT